LTHERVPHKHSAGELVDGWKQIVGKLAEHLGIASEPPIATEEVKENL
jgi:hypothetical protein